MHRARGSLLALIAPWRTTRAARSPAVAVAGAGTPSCTRGYPGRGSRQGCAQRGHGGGEWGQVRGDTVGGR